MEKILTSIITIGDELLIGQTIDTNSAWMAQRLNDMGIWVHRRVAIGDKREDILSALRQESSVSQIVLITGGLGPTADDITKPILCEYFNTQLVQNEEALKNVLHIFESRGLPILERNIEQSMVPESAIIIQNDWGTAPGMWFEKEGVIYVSMPGVPYEMQGVMTSYVLPQLEKHFKTPAVMHQTVVTSGMGESFVAERLVAFEASLPPHFSLAYLPSYSLLKLRLSAFGSEKLEIAAEMSTLFHELKALVEDITVSDQDIPIAQVIGQLLHEKGKTVGTAESCTGGLISSQITSISGSSAYYKGSVVTYANEMKVRLLGVNPATLKAYGAVSEETVVEMVTGALKILETDYAIAVTGIMGPDGGTPEKPVGTVWIAVADANTIITKKHHLRYDRERNTNMAAVYAMNELRKLILQ
ncbi:CinA family nicotinamide mononucleotide deamidase-related protein [Chitinophaga silvatica]|uniref:CinA family nicotinamide mononucleotide deamidase-related protein n=1 Tax=Chitinophaga silvatica TaxID=2282649 RepID=UPI001F31D202|nr:CinA family nicotinamide mononucleotide deamidase-related protein [Chitinophaga silvatica]